MDMLASGKVKEVSELIAQRMKAVEKAMIENSWDRAQYYDLVQPETRTLASSQEELMAHREEREKVRPSGQASGKARRATLPLQQERGSRLTGIPGGEPELMDEVFARLQRELAQRLRPQGATGWNLLAPLCGINYAFLHELSSPLGGVALLDVVWRSHGGQLRHNDCIQPIGNTPGP
eukprot:5733325-Amphidinium_carterae.1